MNMTKIALAALLVAGTASASLATEFDANMANRYPAFTGTQAPRAIQSAPVQLRQQIQNNWVPAAAQAGGVG